MRFDIHELGQRGNRILKTGYLFLGCRHKRMAAKATAANKAEEGGEKRDCSQHWRSSGTSIGILRDAGHP